MHFASGSACKTAHGLHLKVLVVVRIEAETGDEAVHHEFHISVLAASSPPEGFGWVEQQRLVGRERKPPVTHDNFNEPLPLPQWRIQSTLTRRYSAMITFRSMTMDWTRRKMVEWSSQLMYVEALHSLTQAMAALSISCLLPPWPAKAFRKLSRNSFWQSQGREAVWVRVRLSVYFCTCASVLSVSHLVGLAVFHCVFGDGVCDLRTEDEKDYLQGPNSCLPFGALCKVVHEVKQLLCSFWKHNWNKSLQKMMSGSTDSTVNTGSHTEKRVFKATPGSGPVYIFKLGYFFQHQYQVLLPIHGWNTRFLNRTEILITYVYVCIWSFCTALLGSGVELIEHLQD